MKKFYYTSSGSELPSNHTYAPPRNIQQQQRRYSTKTSLCERRDIEKISPEWISGFTDGDASFNISIYRDNKRKSGWSIIPSFAIELKARDLPLLKKKFFEGEGNIHTYKNKPHYIYSVNSVKVLDRVIIPHFNKYPLLSTKRISFLLFKDAIEIIKNKKHLTLEGVHQIMCIRASMNHGISTRSVRSTSEIENIIPVALPQVEPVKASQISSDWLAGFTDAEGCFTINLRTKNEKLWAGLSYFLTQHSRDYLLFKAIKEFLGCGQIYVEEASEVVRFKVENLSSIG